MTGTGRARRPAPHSRRRPRRRTSRRPAPGNPAMSIAARPVAAIAEAARPANAPADSQPRPGSRTSHGRQGSQTRLPESTATSCPTAFAPASAATVTATSRTPASTTSRPHAQPQRRRATRKPCTVTSPASPTDARTRHASSDGPVLEVPRPPRGGDAGNHAQDQAQRERKPERRTPGAGRSSGLTVEVRVTSCCSPARHPASA